MKKVITDTSKSQKYETYESLKNLFNEYQINYREIEHIEEGRSDQIAEIRGNERGQAAKAMVIDVSLLGGIHQYHLLVLPGDRKVDLEVIKKFTKVNKVSFAKTKIMKRLTNCESGAVPPFSFNENLNIIVDPALYQNKEIVFNAGRLDRSIYISVEDYRKIMENEYKEKPRAVELDISQGKEISSKEIKKDEEVERLSQDFETKVEISSCYVSKEKK